MNYRYLGRSALKVSPICLGTMMFGGPTDENVARRIIDSALDRGINFLDCASGYQAGASERIVGRAISARRDDWVLSTKFSQTRDPNPNRGGFSRKAIIASVEASLDRLDTDYIDILYFHQDIPDAPLEEPVRAIADLIQAGKLRYFGVSNFRGWRIAQVAHLADQLGIDRPVASQPLYNIFNRSAEAEELPAAGHYGLGVVSYSPLARGVLTAKYRPDAAPAADTRAGRNDPRLLQTEWRPESVELSQRIRVHAEARGISSIDFAIAWVLNNGLISAVIAGPRTEEQWDSYLPALDVTFDAEDESLIDSLVAPGHPSTPGFTDPIYPIQGRPRRAG